MTAMPSHAYLESSKISSSIEYTGPDLMQIEKLIRIARPIKIPPKRKPEIRNVSSQAAELNVQGSAPVPDCLGVNPASAFTSCLPKSKLMNLSVLLGPHF
jgi:hypothetical protein